MRVMLDTRETLPVGYLSEKRALDLVGASVLLLVTAPLWVLALVALALAQGPPLWFRQQRVGWQGVPFTLWKFRTMVAGDPPRLADRPVGKARHDPRVTPLGRVLRRVCLDELPQLLNVLHGSMSLVGPRPLPVDDVEHPGWLETDDAVERARRLAWFARRHTVPPGLTGLWQISAAPEDDFENWIACDLRYCDTRSLRLDLAILLRTPGAVLRGRRKSG